MRTDSPTSYVAVCCNDVPYFFVLQLFKTVPAVERLLTVSELADAGFPVDIGGNQFDKFRSLKQADGSLLGVIVPKVSVALLLNCN